MIEIPPTNVSDQPAADPQLLLARLFPGRKIRAEGIWLRVGMDALHPESRAGWKLHLSTVPSELLRMIEACAPVLDQCTLPFKLIRCVDDLEDLNDGRFGLMQVGKAATVYPGDEKEAFEVASALSKALAGFTGSSIASDVRFTEEAPVFFRYGSFDASTRIDALGQKQRIVLSADGTTIDDAMTGTAHWPLRAWLPEGGLHDHLHFLRDRLEFLAVLQLSAKGGAFVAVDARPGEGKPLLCVRSAKQAAHADRFGRDAIWAMEREHRLLQEIEELGVTPPPGILVRDEVQAIAQVRPFLSSGKTFWDFWTAPDARSKAGKRRLAAVLAATWAAVGKLHALGIVVRDLSPNNILYDGKRAILLDMELAHRLNHPERPFRRGTLGFYRLEKSRFDPPEYADDYHALLALTWMAHTGAHPALFNFASAARATGPMPFPMSNGLWAAMREGYTLCERQEDMSSFFGTTIPLVTKNFEASREEVPEIGDGFATYVVRALTSLETAPPEDPDVWNVYTGLAGTALVAIEQDSGRFRESLSGVDRSLLLQRLQNAAALVGHIPGFYFGASGIGVALMGMGKILDDDSMLEGGREILTRSHRDISNRMPDLCHGMAGLAWAHLAAYRLSGDEALLESACTVVERLLGLAEPDGQGVIWPWPEGLYGSFSGARLFGFAHGAAGIAYLLAELESEAPGRPGVRDALRGSLETLRAAALPVGEESRGLWWPLAEGDPVVWNAWCHGTPGVLKAFAAADRLTDGRWGEVIDAAWHGIGMANNPGYCLCHGIASRLDAYIDAIAALGARCPAQLQKEALRDALLLAALDVESLEGNPEHNNGELARGLMTGAAGVYRTLLRFDGALKFPYGKLLP